MKAIYTMVGMQHRGSVDFVASLPKGEPIILLRDPNNAHDPNAVMVWARGRHVAFLKAGEAFQLARRMDAIHQPKIEARLTFDGQRWPMAEVDE